jgi:uncharacterized RDD family membrane protein YckC
VKTETFNLPLPGTRVQKDSCGLSRRIIALVIDILILDIIAFAPFASTFVKSFPGSIKDNLTLMRGSIPSNILFIFIFLSILAFIYFTLFQYYFSQTFGMRIVKIKVAGNITFLTSIARSALSLPFFPFYLFWIIEPIAIIYRKQGLIEQWTQTETIIT